LTIVPDSLLPRCLFSTTADASFSRIDPLRRLWAVVLPNSRHGCDWRPGLYRARRSYRIYLVYFGEALKNQFPIKDMAS
jgi:hypothetical protein